MIDYEDTVTSYQEDQVLEAGLEAKFDGAKEEIKEFIRDIDRQDEIIETAAEYGISEEHAVYLPLYVNGEAVPEASKKHIEGHLWKVAEYRFDPAECLADWKHGGE